MSETNKDTWAEFRELARREKQKEADLLAQMKAEAATRGKEPFDITKLAKLAQTSDQGSLNTPEEQQARWESVYYVDFPNVMTLEEFATHVNESSRWSGG